MTVSKGEDELSLIKLQQKIIILLLYVWAVSLKSDLGEADTLHKMLGGITARY